MRRYTYITYATPTFIIEVFRLITQAQLLVTTINDLYSASLLLLG